MKDEIAELAYEFFEREGKVHGRHFEHWVEAEMIIKAKYAEMSEGEQAKAEAPKSKKKAAMKATPKKTKEEPKKTAKTAAKSRSKKTS